MAASLLVVTSPSLSVSREFESTAISPPAPASLTSSGFGSLVTGKRNSVRGRNSLSWVVRRNGFLGSGVAALRNSAKLSGNSVYSARENSNLAGGFCKASLDALIFDCDGVILESEDLHRRAYNLTFEHFNVKCDSKLVDWDTEFYDVLQNTVGGGKPKMRWYFGKNGWPTSTVFETAPESDEDRSTLIDTLQDWKTDKYKDLISSGAKTRPGVLELMDEARSMGIKLAVCSAATKSSVVFCLTNLLGKERFEQLDCFLAGDDVKNKKPDPLIYKVAAENLGVSPDRCLVIEDSLIGLQAARGAGMRCVISYTSSTSNQDFTGSAARYANLGGISLKELIKLMDTTPAAVL
ncbi:hypothetical protein R1sor_019460 [Riccia sorocarpa]|uniref:Haloacid dehalogenase-like hydrolase domain-containing protein n=1 Tax=Riccia sorocarpa TaxID=122646 RepID=A0ABD3ICK6_9MARC